MKWKPPNENSVDFKLVLKFPPLATNASQPDLYARPIFALYVWWGGEGPRADYQPYDVMHVTDDEWERCVVLNAANFPLQYGGLTRPSLFCRMKLSGEQFEDRIVEVHWDPVVEGWKMMRFRDDKPAGNHIKTVEGVIESIRDGVEKEVVSTASLSQGDRLFIEVTSSYWKNAGSYGRLGKPDTTNKANRTNRQFLISPWAHQTSLPLLSNKSRYRHLSLNLRTPLIHHHPTCRRGSLNRSNASGSLLSRTLRRVRKMRPSRRRRRPVLLGFHRQTGRLGTGRSRRRSGARSPDQRNGVVCTAEGV